MELDSSVIPLRPDVPGRGPTEAGHPATHGAGLTSPELLRLFEAEDAVVAAAVRGAHDAVLALGLAMARAVAADGRIVYVGAGTSGRIGALDAAEWEPTFGFPRARIAAVVAGGDVALRRAVEGAEDAEDAAEAALAELGLTTADLVVGLSASGSAAFVRAALERSRALGCARAFVTATAAAVPADPHLIAVVLATGPELLAGSTRLKAAVATHLVLQRASNLCALECGWIHRGLMVEMRPTNRKLRVRAIDIVRELTGLEPAAAALQLERAGDDIKVAVVGARLALAPESARRLLADIGRRLDRIDWTDVDHRGGMDAKHNGARRDERCDDAGADRGHGVGGA
ncbi:MAG: N-acetylmuramic acid 6-phosphate etherase [Planctomycetota bacterium]